MNTPLVTCNRRCGCAPFFDLSKPVGRKDDDIYWLVLELVRVADGPISRSRLDARLARRGVLSRPGEKHHETVNRALAFYQRNELRWTIAVSEPSYEFMHNSPRDGFFRRIRRPSGLSDAFRVLFPPKDERERS